ncbi:mucin-16-like isoform X3 [Engraulis encrasicolus]|uniref:mucin-16-like isoform X3 n=1 Tax=Engraulis encrasicolus TaxID=184585 RepID=UPI002FD33A09
MPEKRLKTRRTVIVPYGLKTWLECVTQAVARECPKHMGQFLADYSQELLQYRDDNPTMNITDLSLGYRTSRGMRPSLKKYYFRNFEQRVIIPFGTRNLKAWLQGTGQTDEPGDSVVHKSKGKIRNHGTNMSRSVGLCMTQCPLQSCIVKSREDTEEDPSVTISEDIPDTVTSLVPTPNLSQAPLGDLQEVCEAKHKLCCQPPQMPEQTLIEDVCIADDNELLTVSTMVASYLSDTVAEFSICDSELVTQQKSNALQEIPFTEETVSDDRHESTETSQETSVKIPPPPQTAEAHHPKEHKHQVAVRASTEQVDLIYPCQMYRSSYNSSPQVQDVSPSKAVSERSPCQTVPQSQKEESTEKTSEPPGVMDEPGSDDAEDDTELFVLYSVPSDQCLRSSADSGSSMNSDESGGLFQTQEDTADNHVTDGNVSSLETMESKQSSASLSSVESEGTIDIPQESPQPGLEDRLCPGDGTQIEMDIGHDDDATEMTRNIGLRLSFESIDLSHSHSHTRFHSHSHTRLSSHVKSAHAALAHEEVDSSACSSIEYNLYTSALGDSSITVLFEDSEEDDYISESESAADTECVADSDSIPDIVILHEAPLVEEMTETSLEADMQDLHKSDSPLVNSHQSLTEEQHPTLSTETTTTEGAEEEDGVPHVVVVHKAPSEEECFDVCLPQQVGHISETGLATAAPELSKEAPRHKAIGDSVKSTENISYPTSSPKTSCMLDTAVESDSHPHVAINLKPPSEMSVQDDSHSLHAESQEPESTVVHSVPLMTQEADYAPDKASSGEEIPESGVVIRPVERVPSATSKTSQVEVSLSTHDAVNIHRLGSDTAVETLPESTEQIGDGLRANGQDEIDTDVDQTEIRSPRLSAAQHSSGIVSVVISSEHLKTSASSSLPAPVKSTEDGSELQAKGEVCVSSEQTMPVANDSNRTLEREDPYQTVTPVVPPTHVLNGENVAETMESTLSTPQTPTLSPKTSELERVSTTACQNSSHDVGSLRDEDTISDEEPTVVTGVPLRLSKESLDLTSSHSHTRLQSSSKQSLKDVSRLSSLVQCSYTASATEVVDSSTYSSMEYNHLSPANTASSITVLFEDSEEDDYISESESTERVGDTDAFPDIVIIHKALSIEEMPDTDFEADRQDLRKSESSLAFASPSLIEAKGSEYAPMSAITTEDAELEDGVPHVVIIHKGPSEEEFLDTSLTLHAENICGPGSAATETTVTAPEPPAMTSRGQSIGDTATASESSRCPTSTPRTSGLLAVPLATSQGPVSYTTAAESLEKTSAETLTSTTVTPGEEDYTTSQTSERTQAEEGCEVSLEVKSASSLPSSESSDHPSMSQEADDPSGLDEISSKVSADVPVDELGLFGLLGLLPVDKDVLSEKTSVAVECSRAVNIDMEVQCKIEASSASSGENITQRVESVERLISPLTTVEDNPIQPESAVSMEDNPATPESHLLVEDNPIEPKSALTTVEDNPIEPKSGLTLEDNPIETESGLEVENRPTESSAVATVPSATPQGPVSDTTAVESLEKTSAETLTSTTVTPGEEDYTTSQTSERTTAEEFEVSLEVKSASSLPSSESSDHPSMSQKADDSSGQDEISSKVSADVPVDELRLFGLLGLLPVDKDVLSEKTSEAVECSRAENLDMEVQCKIQASSASSGENITQRVESVERLISPELSSTSERENAKPVDVPLEVVWASAQLSTETTLSEELQRSSPDLPAMVPAEDHSQLLSSSDNISSPKTLDAAKCSSHANLDQKAYETAAEISVSEIIASSVEWIKRDTNLDVHNSGSESAVVGPAVTSVYMATDIIKTETKHELSTAVSLEEPVDLSLQVNSASLQPSTQIGDVLPMSQVADYLEMLPEPCMPSVLEASGTCDGSQDDGGLSANVDSIVIAPPETLENVVTYITTTGQEEAESDYAVLGSAGISGCMVTVQDETNADVSQVGTRIPRLSPQLSSSDVSKRASSEQLQRCMAIDTVTTGQDEISTDVSPEEPVDVSLDVNSASSQPSTEKSDEPTVSEVASDLEMLPEPNMPAVLEREPSAICVGSLDDGNLSASDVEKSPSDSVVVALPDTSENGFTDITMSGQDETSTEVSQVGTRSPRLSPQLSSSDICESALSEEQLQRCMATDIITTGQDEISSDVEPLDISLEVAPPETSENIVTDIVPAGQDETGNGSAVVGSAGTSEDMAAGPHEISTNFSHMEPVDVSLEVKSPSSQQSIVRSDIPTMSEEASDLEMVPEPNMPAVLERVPSAICVGSLDGGNLSASDVEKSPSDSVVIAPPDSSENGFTDIIMTGQDETSTELSKVGTRSPRLSPQLSSSDICESASSEELLQRCMATDIITTGQDEISSDVEPLDISLEVAPPETSENIVTDIVPTGQDETGSDSAVVGSARTSEDMAAGPHEISTNFSHMEPVDVSLEVKSPSSQQSIVRSDIPTMSEEASDLEMVPEPNVPAVLERVPSAICVGSLDGGNLSASDEKSPSDSVVVAPPDSSENGFTDITMSGQDETSTEVSQVGTRSPRLSPQLSSSDICESALSEEQLQRCMAIDIITTGQDEISSDVEPLDISLEVAPPETSENIVSDIVPAGQDETGSDSAVVGSAGTSEDMAAGQDDISTNFSNVKPVGVSFEVNSSSSQSDPERSDVPTMSEAANDMEMIPEPNMPAVLERVPSAICIGSLDDGNLSANVVQKSPGDSVLVAPPDTSENGFADIIMTGQDETSTEVSQVGTRSPRLSPQLSSSDICESALSEEQLQRCMAIDIITTGQDEISSDVEPLDISLEVAPPETSENIVTDIVPTGQDETGSDSAVVGSAGTSEDMAAGPHEISTNFSLVEPVDVSLEVKSPSSQQSIVRNDVLPMSQVDNNSVNLPDPCLGNDLPFQKTLDAAQCSSHMNLEEDLQENSETAVVVSEIITHNGIEIIKEDEKLQCCPLSPKHSFTSERNDVFSMLHMADDSENLPDPCLGNDLPIQKTMDAAQCSSHTHLEEENLKTNSETAVEKGVAEIITHYGIENIEQDEKLQCSPLSLKHSFTSENCCTVDILGKKVASPKTSIEKLSPSLISTYVEEAELTPCGLLTQNTCPMEEPPRSGITSDVLEGVSSPSTGSVDDVHLSVTDTSDSEKSGVVEEISMAVVNSPVLDIQSLESDSAVVAPAGSAEERAPFIKTPSAVVLSTKSSGVVLCSSESNVVAEPPSEVSEFRCCPPSSTNEEVIIIETLNSGGTEISPRTSPSLSWTSGLKVQSSTELEPDTPTLQVLSSERDLNSPSAELNEARQERSDADQTPYVEQQAQTLSAVESQSVEDISEVSTGPVNGTSSPKLSPKTSSMSIEAALNLDPLLESSQISIEDSVQSPSATLLLPKEDTVVSKETLVQGKLLTEETFLTSGVSPVVSEMKVTLCENLNQVQSLDELSTSGFTKAPVEALETPSTGASADSVGVGIERSRENIAFPRLSPKVSMILQRSPSLDKLQGRHPSPKGSRTRCQSVPPIKCCSETVEEIPIRRRTSSDRLESPRVSRKPSKECLPSFERSTQTSTPCLPRIDQATQISRTVLVSASHSTQTSKTLLPIATPESRTLLPTIDRDTQISHKPMQGVDKESQMSRTSVKLCHQGSQVSPESQDSQMTRVCGASPAKTTQETSSPTCQTSSANNWDDRSHTVCDIHPGSESPTGQVAERLPKEKTWTLYQLGHKSDGGLLSTQALSRPPFHGEAYIRSFGPGAVLLSERPGRRLRTLSPPITGKLVAASAFEQGRRPPSLLPHQLVIFPPHPPNRASSNPPDYVLVVDTEDFDRRLFSNVAAGPSQPHTVP